MRDSKITFRVSDDLLERVDGIEESRSEIMREALRTYLEEGAETRGEERRRNTQHGPRKTRPTIDEALRGIVEEVVEETVEGKLERRESDNVNVTVNVPEGGSGKSAHSGEEKVSKRKTADEGRQEPPVEDAGSERKTCHQCGEEVDDDHVHCPNCGAKASRRVFCDCGDEIRTDWSFCPSCGRRTPASHALSNE